MAEWWEVAGKTCLAAFQAINAASYAASLVNLADPGTDDAWTEAGKEPAFAAETGWTSDGSKFLRFGIAPTRTMTLLVRYAGYTSGNYYLAGYRESPWTDAFCLNVGFNETISFFRGEASSSPVNTQAAGVIGLASVDAYVDGTLVATLTDNGTDPGSGETFIFARKAVSDSTAFIGSIQAVALYTTALSAGEMATVMAAMAALSYAPPPVDYPDPADVRAGLVYNSETQTGTLDLPAVGDVRAGVTFGAAAEFTGTLGLPAEAEVESGVGYGEDDTEFTGTLVVGSDWTDGEKEQIRQALGITGAVAATTGTGNLDTVQTNVGDLATDAEVAAAVRVELATELANVDAAVSSRAVPGDAMALTSGERTTLAQSIGAYLTSLTAYLSAIAAAVWAYATRTITASSAGAIAYTYTLTSTVGGTAIAQADVWVTTDEAGNNVVAAGTTSDLGTVTFYLDAGDYYLWRAKAGYTFTNPTEIEVTA